MQLKYGHGLYTSFPSHASPNCPDTHKSAEEHSAAHGYSESTDDHFKDLGFSFREFGFCMVELGLHLARICDKAIGGNELEKSILESGTAKGRLIHYHSSLDTRIIKESRRKGTKKGKSISKSQNFRSMDENNSCLQPQKDGDDGRSYEKCSDLWQQWHYDYGTFTVLTSPMFIRPRCCETVNGKDGCEKLCGLECPSPSGHSYLLILHPNKNNICVVKSPPESFIVQVGEAADIMSRRKLQSTLHSVMRPMGVENLSRETCVVFLHPPWNKVFDISDYPMERLSLNPQSEINGSRPQGDEEELKKLKQEIHKIIPPLSSRLRDGMTFAEFSRQTTKQYYGGSGLQSNR